MKRFTMAVILLLSLVANAAEKTYETGKLVDFRRDQTGSGALRAQGSFCMAIQVRDVTYLVEHESYWRWGSEPTELVVGDPVQVRIDGSKLFLKRSSGEFKTKITRRERSDSPATCALQVQTKN